VGVEVDREVDHVWEIVKVLAMDDHVEGQEQSSLSHQPGDFYFLDVAALVAADMVTARLFAILEAKL
jgi:hypothetical protein